MSSFDAYLSLEKNADGDETWGDAMRANLDTLGYALHGAHVYVVDALYTDGNLYGGAGSPGGSRRRFATIQAAITAAETEGHGEPLDGGTGYVILIQPGTYAEDLTITESVTLAALGGRGGAWSPGVKITGAASTADSIITISPADGENISVELCGIVLENAYNVTNAVEITEPYAIDAQSQATFGGVASRLSLVDCRVRMQTNGQDNVWTSGIKCSGWWTVTLDRCQIGAYDYGGGNNNGIVRRLLDINGDGSAKTSQCAAKRCEFEQASYDDAGQIVTWNFDNYSFASAYDCACNQIQGDSYTVGGTGTNTSVGIESGAPAQKNGFGLEEVYF